MKMFLLLFGMLEFVRKHLIVMEPIFFILSNNEIERYISLHIIYMGSIMHLMNNNSYDLFSNILKLYNGVKKLILKIYHID